LQNDSQTVEVRRGFGILFIGVSIAVGVASVLSEVAFANRAPLYYYAIIWFASFAITFSVIFRKFRKIIPSIRSRMKYSIRWSANSKALNGLCWAAPFAAIPVFPSLYQFLILLGIGLGNFSTYVLMKKYSRLDNREQMIVGLISLASIPVAWVIDLTLFVARHDIAVMLSRILISNAYGVGGIYALLNKDG
jgi:hypothetical protein